MGSTTSRTRSTVLTSMLTSSWSLPPTSNERRGPGPRLSRSVLERMGPRSITRTSAQVFGEGGRGHGPVGHDPEPLAVHGDLDVLVTVDAAPVLERELHPRPGSEV